MPFDQVDASAAPVTAIDPSRRAVFFRGVLVGVASAPSSACANRAAEPADPSTVFPGVPARPYWLCRNGLAVRLPLETTSTLAFALPNDRADCPLSEVHAGVDGEQRGACSYSVVIAVLISACRRSLGASGSGGGWFWVGCPRPVVAAAAAAELGLDPVDDGIGGQAVAIVQGRQGAGREELVG